MSEEQNNTLAAFTEEVKSTFFGRLNSPFLGAFVVSWLAWNHRLIFVLFSDLEVEDRFKFIDETLYPSTTYSLWMNVGGPLISSLVYIFVLPWVTEWVHEWNLSRARRLKEAERRSAGEYLLSYPESLAFRRLREQAQNQIENLKRELKQTKKSLYRWRARSEMQRSPTEGLDALPDYVASHSFIVVSDILVRSTVRGKIDFSRDGTLLSTVSGHLGGAQSWSIDSSGLALYDGGDERLCSFKYQVAEGTFMASIEGCIWQLSPEEGE